MSTPNRRSSEVELTIMLRPLVEARRYRTTVMPLCCSWRLSSSSSYVATHSANAWASFMVEAKASCCNEMRRAGR